MLVDSQEPVYVMSCFFSDLEDRINLQESSQVSAALAGCCYCYVRSLVMILPRWAGWEGAEYGSLLLKCCRETPKLWLPDLSFCSASAKGGKMSKMCKGLGPWSFCWLEVSGSFEWALNPTNKFFILGIWPVIPDASKWSLFLLEEHKAGGAMLADEVGQEGSVLGPPHCRSGAHQ